MRYLSLFLAATLWAAYPAFAKNPMELPPPAPLPIEIAPQRNLPPVLDIEADRENPEQGPAQVASDGELSIMQIMAMDCQGQEQSMFDRHAMLIEKAQSLRAATLNDRIELYHAAKGCKTEANGLCSLALTIQFFRPDGTLHSGDGEPQIFDFKPTPEFAMFTFSHIFFFDENDNPGTYRIATTLADLNADKTVTSNSLIEIGKGDPANSPARCPVTATAA
ncbi:hypothetical protein ACFOWX_03000 [Sphingorhabdus arenilitoris]|uniref:DUF3617 family protein n=1 Tax=Sphingorhabdus arenilitoris TaxID=1490041 RepID=A0ABV8RD87_9SPHN